MNHKKSLKQIDLIIHRIKIEMYMSNLSVLLLLVFTIALIESMPKNDFLSERQDELCKERGVSSQKHLTNIY